MLDIYFLCVIIKLQKKNKCSFWEEIKMNAVIISVLEVLVVSFTVWALFHEDRLADFEDRFFARIRRSRLKVVKGNHHAKKHCA